MRMENTAWKRQPALFIQSILIVQLSYSNNFKYLANVDVENNSKIFGAKGKEK